MFRYSPGLTTNKRQTRYPVKWWVSCSLLLAPLLTMADSSIATEAQGAAVYKEHCMRCHKNKGPEDGILPGQVNQHPGIEGAAGVDRSESPPWGKALTASESEAVVLFLDLLSTRKVAAIRLLRKSNRSETTDTHPGRELYKSYCSLCHGGDGLGNGRMAEVITNPPPFNLTLSRVPEEYLRLIIEEGGAGVGRSAQMPPWKNQLSSEQVDVIINYLLTLRIGDARDVSQ